LQGAEPDKVREQKGKKALLSDEPAGGRKAPSVKNSIVARRGGGRKKGQRTKDFRARAEVPCYR